MKSLVTTSLPTRFGEFDILAFPSGIQEQPHLVLKSRAQFVTSVPLVRIHSECWTGDVAGSLRCDCGEQLDRSFERIASEGGLLLYLRQEGRGIGLIEKLKAYNLQDGGLDTYEANEALGHQRDGRKFEVAAVMLAAMNIQHVRLLTNNPEKVEGLEQMGIVVVETVSLEVSPNQHNKKYLTAKEEERRRIKLQKEIEK